MRNWQEFSKEELHSLSEREDYAINVVKKSSLKIRIFRALIIVCLGSISPSILVLCVWLATFGQMFNLIAGVTDPICQVFSLFTTCATLFTVIVAVSTEDL